MSKKFQNAFYFPIPFNSIQSQGSLLLPILPHFALKKTDNYEYFSFSSKYVEINRVDWRININQIQDCIEKSMNLPRVKLIFEELMVFKSGGFYKNSNQGDLCFVSLQSEYTGGKFNTSYLGFQESFQLGSLQDGTNFLAFRNGSEFEIEPIESGCMVCMKHMVKR